MKEFDIGGVFLLGEKFAGFQKIDELIDQKLIIEVDSLFKQLY